MKSITIIIPTLNEEKGIGKTIDRVYKTGIKNIEILVVDGDSTDKTRDIAEKKGARVIARTKEGFNKSKNGKVGGYGLGYKAGFEKAEGEIMVTLDGDGTYPPEEIPKLLKILEKEKIDFITTKRFSSMEKKSMSLLHNLGNRILTLTNKILFSLPFEDSQSGMWVLTKKAWEKIKNNVKSNEMPFSQEIKIEAYKKLRCKEVAIKYGAREGKAKLNAWKDGKEIFVHQIKKKFFK